MTERRGHRDGTDCESSYLVRLYCLSKIKIEREEQ
jgi:hypothetical protein